MGGNAPKRGTCQPAPGPCDARHANLPLRSYDEFLRLPASQVRPGAIRESTSARGPNAVYGKPLGCGRVKVSTDFKPGRPSGRSARWLAELTIEHRGPFLVIEVSQGSTCLILSQKSERANRWPSLTSDDRSSTSATTDRPSRGVRGIPRVLVSTLRRKPCQACQTLDLDLCSGEA